MKFRSGCIHALQKSRFYMITIEILDMGLRPPFHLDCWNESILPGFLWSTIMLEHLPITVKKCLNGCSTEFDPYITPLNGIGTRRRKVLFNKNGKATYKSTGETRRGVKKKRKKQNQRAFESTFKTRATPCGLSNLHSHINSAFES